jgi:hypothetical protein
VATFDLALPDAKLAIEAHSRKHHFTEADESSDEFRDHEASVLDWDVMYIGYIATRRPEQALRMVLDRARSRRALLAERSSS